jgi:hypothetical protein
MLLSLQNSQSFCSKFIVSLGHNLKIENMQSIEKEIEIFVSKKKRGRIYFTKDFQDFGSDGAVRITLMRLVNNKILLRLARGIFYYPIVDKKLKLIFYLPLRMWSKH